MIVCVCHRVSDRDIACAVREGCCSFDELQDELRVGTKCGACREHARDTFEQHAAMHAINAAPPRQAIHVAVERRGETTAAARI
jgi:bacterioferritin-associated ferredoxin